jgi:hypothetical protein
LEVWQVAGKPENSDEDFLFFFPETDEGRQAGLSSLRRLDMCLDASHAVVASEAITAQSAVFSSFGIGVWDRLGELKLPVLVANGAQVDMISAFVSTACRSDCHTPKSSCKATRDTPSSFNTRKSSARKRSASCADITHLSRTLRNTARSEQTRKQMVCSQER